METKKYKTKHCVQLLKLSRLLQIGINGNELFWSLRFHFDFPDYFKSELMETSAWATTTAPELGFPDYFKSELMETVESVVPTEKLNFPFPITSNRN